VARPSIAERLERNSIPEPNSGCRIWLGKLTPEGYGLIRIGSLRDGSRRLAKAYRVSFETHRGPLPPGLVPDHLCRVRSCINAWHLEPVTGRVNILRGVSPSAEAARRTACPLGHPYDLFQPGHRRCRTCTLRRARDSYAQRRAANSETPKENT